MAIPCSPYVQKNQQAKKRREILKQFKERYPTIYKDLVKEQRTITITISDSEEETVTIT